MDLILDFLIKRKDFNRLSLHEIMAEWGGETFSHTPPKYVFGTSMNLIQNIDMNIEYYKNFLGEMIDITEYKVFTLKGDTLSELEFAVNNEKNIINNNDLLSFIRKLYELLNTFAIIKFQNEEDIDEKHIIGNAESAIKIFLDSLNWEHPKGVLLVKK